jgi:hypothetical protein
MEHALRTAPQAGYARLYNYQRFCPEWLSTTLREEKIHCSNPANLNDPWDCRPWYDNHSIETPDQIEAFICWTRQFPQPGVSPHQQAKYESMLRTNAGWRQKFIEGFSACNQRVISHRGLYCLTPDPCSTLMWSHYADNHRGICLEFDTANPLFSEAVEVAYRSEYPRWVPHEMEQIAFEMFLTKAEDWSYEKEFRIIGGVNMEKDHLNLDGDWLRQPPGALQSVIVGCEADHDAIRKGVSRYAPNLPVRRVVRVSNHYRLQIES